MVLTADSAIVAIVW